MITQSLVATGSSLAAEGRSIAVGRRGVSLIEVMVTMVILGVLISMTAPLYRRAIEQSRVDVAAAHLRTIWAAQRLYFLDHQAYSSDFGSLAADSLIDTAPLAADPNYTYSILGGGASFTATAVRTGSSVYSGTLTINTSGSVTGAVSGSGGSLEPGFQ